MTVGLLRRLPASIAPVMTGILTRKPSSCSFINDLTQCLKIVISVPSYHREGKMRPTTSFRAEMPSNESGVRKTLHKCNNCAVHSLRDHGSLANWNGIIGSDARLLVGCPTSMRMAKKG